ncbi:MAG TPA: DUF1015 domain-containing protein [Actinomycetota bacterium]|nr:DUF1015 domain-containing protein [Actinomycetota bacterium]
MPRIAPFDGLLYSPAVDDLASVTAPPYDVILPHDLPRYHQASSRNIARVDLGEGGAGTDPDDKYTEAGELLRRWQEDGTLVPTGGPAVYAYEMRFLYRARERSIRGVVVEVELREWGDGVIPHERTMPGPVEDRLAHLRATAANISPIYAVVTGPCPPQTELIERAASRAPDRELVDDEGVRHRLWVERDPDPALLEWYRDRSLLIADGHHRYQTALAHQRAQRGANGPGPWDAVMMLVVDAAVEEPPVLPIHRVVDVDPLPTLGTERVRDLGEILAWLSDDDLRFGAAYRHDGGLHHVVGRLGGDPPTVAALHEHLLERLPGVREVAFVHDPALAEEMVHTGRRDLALFLPPARVEHVRATVEAGRRLPEKSTYFWPKPRTGMVIRRAG